jgi:hypothetical protein
VYHRISDGFLLAYFHFCSRFVLAVLLTAALTNAQEPEEKEAVDSSWRRPLASRNQIPLSLLFIYLTPDRAGASPRGQINFEVAFDYSNVILAAEDDSEAIRLDLEYLRTLVSFERGFGAGVELGVEVPFYVYYGGFLDPFVSDFHEALGLPNFLRGQTPNGLIEYRYRRGDEVLFSGQSSFSAMGDVTLTGKKALFDRGRTGLALRGALKLPTGEPETLSGSGATDFGLGVAFDRIGERFGLYLNASYHFLGSTETLRTNDYFALMASADWRWKPRITALLQVDYARPSIEGELPFFDRSSSQLALGLRYRHSETFVYEWRFVEDLSTFSPDFTIAFQMGVRLGKATE